MTPRSPRVWVLGALLVLLALVPRVWVLERDSVDADELFSRRVAILPVADGLELVRYDVVHPPLYYGLLHVAMDLLGDGAVPMRLPSLLAGVVVVGLAIAFGVRATGSAGAGLLAGMLVAFSQQQIFYSAHARSYSLYAVLILLMFGACARACREPDRRSRWLVFALSGAVATLTHYLGSFYMVSTLPVALVRRDRRALVSWVIATAAAGALSLGWVAMVIPYLHAKGGLGENLAWVGAPGLYDLLSTYATFNGLPEIPRGTALSLLLGLLLLGSALHALWRAGSRPERDWILLAIGGALVPPILAYVASSPPFNAPIWGYRHLHPSQACWAVGAAAGAWHCFGRNGRLRAVASGAALLFACSGLPEVFTYPLHEPFTRVAARLADPKLDGLPVFTVNANISTPVNFYRQARDPVRLIPPEMRGTELPARFVFLYRREDRRDVARIGALLADLAPREPALRDVESIARKPDDQWGTTIAVVEPPAAP